MPNPISQHFTLADISIDGLTAAWNPNWIGIVSLTIFGAYLIQRILEYLDYPVLSLVEIAWNAFVYIMPSPVVLGLRSRTLNRAGLHRSDTTSSQHAEKSEILRNAIVLGGGGVLGRASSDGNAPKGLGNWDNSCYQNSVLQALASLPSLADFFVQIDQELDDIPDSTTLSNLKTLIQAVNDISGNQGYLWTPPRLKSMSSWQQQDAQEYFSKLVEALEKDVVAKVRNRNLGPASTGLDKICDENNNVSSCRNEARLEESMRNHAVSHQKPLVENTQSEEQIFQNPLEGLLAQRVGCTKCGYAEGLSLIPFNCMTLPLGRKSYTDIDECLSESTSLEYIEGVECAKCTLLETKQRLQKLLGSMHASARENENSEPDTVKKPTGSSNPIPIVEQRLQAIDTSLQDEDFSDNALTQKCQIPKKIRAASTKSRQATIIRAPRCLVLHVNRSMFDEYTGNLLKNYAEVQYPKVLDLGPWLVGKHSSEWSNDSSTTCKDWEMDPSKSMIQPASRHSTGQGPCFELRAAVTHYGRHENGHYVCYRRLPAVAQQEIHPSAVRECKDPESRDHPRDDNWWRLSDETVTSVSEEDALAQSGAFMLFYERIKKRSDPPIEAEEPEVTVTQDFANEEVSREASTDSCEEAVIEPLPVEEAGSVTWENQSQEHLISATPSSPTLTGSENKPSESSKEDEPQIAETDTNSGGRSNMDEETSVSAAANSTRTFSPPAMRTAGPGYRGQEDDSFHPPQMMVTT